MKTMDNSKYQTNSTSNLLNNIQIPTQKTSINSQTTMKKPKIAAKIDLLSNTDN